MKLRTKITLTSCIILFVALAICNLSILFLVQRSYMNEAKSASFQNAMVDFNNLKNATNRLETKVDDDVMNYLIKEMYDDYLICIKPEVYVGNSEIQQAEFIYNNTVFTLEDLNGIDFDVKNTVGGNTSSYLLGKNVILQGSISWKNMDFLVYKMYIEGYELYKLEDITYVGDRIVILAVCLLIITIAVTIVFSVVISLMMKKILKPLKELNEAENRIADGNYDQRISVAGSDEISELSKNFNRMADAVELKTYNLEEADRRKTLFMGNLTHELKTPLTAISGYSKTLLSVKLSEEDKEEALSYIYSESLRLERLSKKMMNLLLIDEEEHIAFEMVSAKTLFNNAGEACSKLLSDNGIVMECHEQGESFRVDADLMTEVLINLIDNAVKASDSGGRITLSAEEGEIRVQDFGKGIPDEERDKILEPFYMIDKSRSRKNGGAGLGLAITTMILKKHNCSLAIESEVGKGTCMILHFV